MLFFTLICVQFFRKCWFWLGPIDILTDNSRHRSRVTRDQEFTCGQLVSGKWPQVFSFQERKQAWARFIYRHANKSVTNLGTDKNERISQNVPVTLSKLPWTKRESRIQCSSLQFKRLVFQLLSALTKNTSCFWKVTSGCSRPCLTLVAVFEYFCLQRMHHRSAFLLSSFEILALTQNTSKNQSLYKFLSLRLMLPYHYMLNFVLGAIFFPKKIYQTIQ